jgi:hypothetical protein
VSKQFKKGTIVDKSRFLYCLFVLSVFLCSAGAQPRRAESNSSIPHLRHQGTATQLIVHGKPFLMLGGELGNSSASDLKYMAPIWPKLKAMCLNTILMPFYWELIEPEEGKFDFALVDSLILLARKNNLKIVALWFGSWKNSMSCYAPHWVKTSEERFPRARAKSGRAEEILTPFSEANKNADAKAFAGLMKHLRVIDKRQSTVVMIQVENEIGMIPDARDYCEEAEKAFLGSVPPELISYLQKNKNSLTKELAQTWESAGMRTSGTWEEVFGKGLQADEVFMAWNFARYANDVAEAGKKEYPLPMYVNAALIRPGFQPGQYPSGGPLPHLLDIWRAAAPQIDFLAPDIYFKDFAEWLGKYDRAGNAVFIPEVDQRQSATNAFYAFARHNSMGYNPFSIESAANPESNQFSEGYNILHQLTPLILEHQGKGTMDGFLLDSASQTARMRLGKYIFTVKHEYTWPFAARVEGEAPRYGGLIIQTGADDFIIAGSGAVITFQSAADDGTIAGIASMDEGTFVKGKWVVGRRMNGDQDHQGRHMDLPGEKYSMQKVKLYRFK